MVPLTARRVYFADLSRVSLSFSFSLLTSYLLLGEGILLVVFPFIVSFGSPSFMRKVATWKKVAAWEALTPRRSFCLDVAARWRSPVIDVNFRRYFFFAFVFESVLRIAGGGVVCG